MTNHFSSHKNRFGPRLLDGGANGFPHEPPGGLPIIGKREKRINGLELVAMISQQMMQLPLVSGISEGVMATITARGNPVTPEESYTLKLVDALAAYQLAVRDIVASEQARVKTLVDAASNQPPPAEDPFLP